MALGEVGDVFFRFWRRISSAGANKLVKTPKTSKGAGVADDESTKQIASLKRLDGSAWSMVVDRHLGEVYGFIFHLVGGDRAIAEDLNQETWLEAIDGIGRLDAAQGSFRNWLFGIARRRVALHYRRASAKKSTVSGDPVESLAECDVRSILPEDVMEQMERAAVVRAAMLAIPEDRRRSLVWKYVEGLSTEAIAVRLGKSAKAAESLLSRAREQLRDLLRAYQTSDDERRRTTKESFRA